MKASDKSLGLSELIERIKQELLAEPASEAPKLFSVDEITLELNFVISGDIDGGFNLGVVTLGSQVSEERVQKITLKLTPLATKEQLVEGLNAQPEAAQRALQAAQEGLIKGGGEFK